MENFKNKNLQTAQLLIRFYGGFGVLTELLFIFSIINFFPAIIYEIDNNNLYIITFFISVILYIIYVLIIQAKNGRTYAQKIQKIYIFNENGESIQLKDSFKRMASKLIVFLFWLIPWFILSCLITLNNNQNITMLQTMKNVLFFAIFSAPILMIPIISNKKQTLYDYLSSTIVLVDYEEIKKGERENINKLIDDPFAINQENQNVSIQARLIAIIIFFILKIFKKKF